MSKHIDNFIWEKYRIEEIDIQYVKTDKQLVDPFMKILLKQKFQNLLFQNGIKNINMICPI